MNHTKHLKSILVATLLLIVLGWILLSHDNDKVTVIQAEKPADRMDEAFIKTPHQPDYIVLAECAGTFAAAAASSQDDPDSEKVFLNAGQLSLNVAKELGAEQKIDPNRISDIGLKTMESMLKGVEKNRKEGRLAISIKMDSCITKIQFMQESPNTI